MDLLESRDILEFSGEHRWLSNFWAVSVRFDGMVFPSVEHAYQAAKAADPIDRLLFQQGTAGQAKRRGRTIAVRSDWEAIKIGVMRDLLAEKFADGSDLAQRLIDTWPALLVEGNTWGDTFWGVCRGKGRNHLGELLMARRQALRSAAMRRVPDEG